MKDRILAGLNDQQLEAVRYFAGPLSIIASAGSGKTRVITHKVAYLIDEQGIPPASILAVTFTNKAANEMKDRVRRLTRGRTPGPQISTFHAFGLKMLRQCAESAGFDRGWRVVDAREQKRIIHQLIKDRDGSLGRDTREKICRRINFAKMNLLFPNNQQLLINKGFVGKEADFYRAYQEVMKENKLWDYEDLISLPVKLLQSNPKILQRYRGKFQYLMVDEFQDINPNQYQLIKLIMGGRKGITVVGDDDQAIYSWRGANIEFLFHFEKDFPGSRIIKLERNYRSTQPILDLANRLIDKNKKRKAKKMWTHRKSGQRVCLLETDSREEEAQRVADFILRCRRRHPECFPLAILYRINAQSLAFETALGERDIPFRIIKGLRFFQRKEIQDCLCMITLVMDPADDRAFLRLVDFLPLGIGPKTQQVIVELGREKHLPLLEVLRKELPEKYRARELFALIHRLHQKKDHLSLRRILERMLQKSGYLEILAEKKEEGRKLNVEEFGKFLSSWEKTHKDRDFGQLMDYIQLNEGDREEKPGEDVLLLTMHNAKGLEFPCVVVSGVNQTYMPFFLRVTQEEVEEERRLFYVALTRAIRKLVLSTGGMQPSMFLEDIPASLYYRTDSVEAMFHRDPDAQAERKKGRESQPELYVDHPLFGKGKILNSLGGSKYFVRFPDQREIVVDVSLIKAQILSH